MKTRNPKSEMRHADTNPERKLRDVAGATQPMPVAQHVRELPFDNAQGEPLAAGASRESHAASRHRGNVLILVVAALVLMVLIGTAYIQAARNDRAATETMNTNNIGMAVDAETARVAALIKADLIADDGDILDGRDGGDTFPGDGSHDPFTSRESYDYPDQDIDPWLAATGPGGSLAWSNITNVTGETSSGAATSTWSLRGNGATLTASNATGASALDITTNDAADADGDGITDSRWVNSAIGSVRGTRYVAAIRVVDLASLLNINVATALTDSSSNFTYASDDSAPHWFFPTEIDLNRFMLDKGATAAEVQDLLAYRFGETSVTLPTPLLSGSTYDRGRFWKSGPAQYSNFNNGDSTDYAPLGVAEELKLRRLNGLNSPEHVGTALDQTMAAFMRDGNGTDPEADYRDFNSDIATYFADEPRHQMTTVSGTSIVTAKLDSTAARTTQVDLNTATDAQIATAIAETYQSATAGSIVPGGGYGSVDEFAAQMTAAIRDYRDADNRITRVTHGSATNRLGFELLPYIAEVYAQSVYELANVGDITGTPPNLDVKWTKKSTVDGYAIEIRNPYNRSIVIDEIKLYIGSGSSNLSTLAGKSTMDANEVLVLYRDNDGGGGNDDIASMAASGATTENISENWPTSSSFEVKLTAMFQDGTEWTDGYVVYPSGGFPPEVNESGVGTAPSAGDTKYYQISSRGTGEGLNVMTITQAEVEQQSIEPSASGSWQEIDDLGTDSKTNGNPTTPISAGQQIVWRDDTSSLFWQAGEVAQMVVVPLTSTTTVAQAWADRATVSDWMINFSTTEYVDNSDPNLAVPHAMALVDRLTTLSPLTDGVDNDGDGSTDEPDEVFVPGRINLNTATAAMLKRVMPIPNATTRDEIIDAIVEYRDKAGAFTGANRGLLTGYRDQIGMAHFGEVFLASWSILGGDSADNWKLSDGGDQVTVDFATPDSTTADDVINDREEQAMAMRWLGQVSTVRSDVFAVYVTVRGYPAGDWTTPTESIRFVAILDRSGIRAADDKVKVLAVMRY